MRLTKENIASLVFAKIAFMGAHAVPFTTSKLERDGETAIAAVWEKLAALSLKPRPEPQPFKDEEWSITWSSNGSGSRFSLDLQKEVIGAHFRFVTRDWSKDIIALFAKESFRTLGGRHARSMACQYEVQFLLPSGMDNRRLVAEKVVPSWDKSCLSAWASNSAQIGRFDVKVALDAQTGYDAFASLEFPGNEAYRTVWTQFTVQAGDEAAPADNNDLIDGLLAATERVFSGHLPPLLMGLLGDVEVEYLRPTRQ
jgi:hypothetical protein